MTENRCGYLDRDRFCTTIFVFDTDTDTDTDKRRGQPILMTATEPSFRLGDILEVDLDRHEWRRVPYPREVAARFLAGRGFNAQALLHRVPPGTDPLGPDNCLIICCGFLTGTAAPASSRLHVGALSPLTGLLGSSNVGGGFGRAVHSCGIHAVILRGCSPRPVFLMIDGEDIRLCDARPYWGLDTWETESRLKDALGGTGLRVMTIGPAGENGALFACIIGDRDHAAGRTGMGTVMGAKRLKAIVVRERRTRRSPGERGSAAVRQFTARIRGAAEFEPFSRYGGAGYLTWADEMGFLATRNYRSSRFEHVDRVDGKSLHRHVVRTRGCGGCPVRCKAELRFPRGKLQGRFATRPEFEAMAALGPKCGLDSLDRLVHLDNLCSRLGLDIISAGSVLAFAMDLFEGGRLTCADTGGLELRWGDADVMETLIHQMSAQEGFGARLAQGVRRFSAQHGPEAARRAPHVKGLELTAYHPLALPGTALGYAVASRGGDFSDVYAVLEYRSLSGSSRDPNQSRNGAALVRGARIATSALDCLGLCKVPALSLLEDFGLEPEAELASALTGWDLTAGDLLEAGERTVHVERLFILKHGLRPLEDTLPAMFFDREYTPPDVPARSREELEAQIRSYYRLMGWDERGEPTEETLVRLDLLDVAGLC